MFIDSHCHLDFPELQAEHDNVFALMQKNQVTHALTISTTLKSFPDVLRVAESRPNLWCSAGVHPDEQIDDHEPTVEELLRLADHPKVVAIGETGLDYYRLPEPLDWQRERFRTHIRAARQCKKPLVIHTRNASADTLRLMREENAGEAGGVMHCFTESQDVARASLELGFYISLSGIVTFKSAKDLQAVAKMVPLDRLLIETDSPFLAPTPHRGKMNQPGYVRHVGEFIAQLRGVSVEAIADATTANFYRLFADTLKH
ncbi:MAG: TatD family hydrolase [Rhodocyclaceae bacterium]|jgi:TatD DNase family protein|nr:TatD family hydrolase [Rhodocyclaceae bacterium]MCA3021021.1 TatD family hydrolase [Rhodocyclaceae bacterium]